MQQSARFQGPRLRPTLSGFFFLCFAFVPACAQEKNPELEKATNWLKSTMEKYGESKGPYDPEVFKVSHVKFDGCSMQWMESRWEPSSKFLIETTYRLQLRDLNCNGYDGVFEVNGIEGGSGHSEWVRIRNPGGDQKIHIEESFYFTDAKGAKVKQKGEGRSRWEGMINIPIKIEVQDEFVKTLDRAVKLCGGVPQNR